MGQAVARRLNADHSDEQGPRQPCGCGEKARYAGRRPKTFTAALGEITLERAWYHCEHCHRGFSPRDRAFGLDGTGVPVRKDETRGRKGKQPDGAAKTRECKVVVVWTAETRDKHGLPVRDPDSASCNAAIETVASRDLDTEPSPFASRVLREAERRRFNHAQRCVVLGDGAAWIWNLVEEHFPHAIQIVDIFHAKHYLFDAANAIYGPETDLAHQWKKPRRDELDQGRIHDILAALRVHANTCEEARKCSDYINNNRHRMHYPEFQAMGLCAATGIVEGACKNIVASRLKRGGMH